MLDERDIQQALHARRVVPLVVASPHGPLGLEQLAAAVARIVQSPASSDEERIRRPISLSVRAWERLESLANTATQGTAGPHSASEVATAIIEHFLETNP
jgi:hypothetical protein